MIYIKNYSSLTSHYIRRNDFYLELINLTGKNIIVFTESGGFQGILTEVLKDSIRLRQGKRNAVITIMIKHIAAVSYNYV